MVAVTTEELVVLALAGDDPGSGDDVGAGSRAALSVVELGDRLAMGAETMADRINLLSTLSGLEASGDVEETTSDGQRVYRLTPQGSERAARIYERVADREIEVRNGTAAEITLAEVDRYLEAPAVVRALARVTDDGVLYLDDEVHEAFCNREAGLEALTDHLEATRAGEGRAVLVAGEPGIGKTALVEEFLTRGREVRVLRGGCRDDAEPYHAVREALADHPTGAFDRPGVDPADAEALADRRRALFADVADGLLELATEEPVVLFLDDLQAAGGPTLDLLAFLVERLPEGRVLLVGTYRPGDVTADPPSDPSEEDGDDALTHEGDDGDDPLADDTDDDGNDALAALVAALREAGPHDHLELEAFDRADTRGLVEWLVGSRRVPESFVDLVHDRTGGNPLFVTESVTRLLDTGELDPERDRYPARVPIPEEVADAVAARLSALDQPAREVLRTGAVIGEAFEDAVLERAVDLPPGDVREYVDVLVDAGLFERVDGRLRFKSGVVRRTVADRLPDERRASYHERVATALTAVTDDDPERSAAVASHYERAGEPANALDAWLEAAAHAESVYAHERALDVYGHALELARERDERETMVDVLESMGEVQALLGEFEDATRTLEYVLSTAGDVDRRQRVARKLAERRRWWDEHDAAIDTANRGLALGGGDPETPEECRLLLAKANALTARGDMAAARPLFDEALSLARELDDRRLLADTLREHANAVWRHSPEAVDDGTVERMEEAIELLEDVGDEVALARAIDNLGTVHFYLGDLGPSREYTVEALERLREVGDRKWALAVHYNLAVHLTVEHVYADGDPDEAMDAIEAAHAEARALADEGLAARIHMVEAMLLWRGYHRGRAALSTFEDALDRVRELGLARWRLHVNNFLSTLALYVADDPERARDHARRLVELARETDRSLEVALGLVLLGTVARETGDPAGARVHLEAALETAREAEAAFQEVRARTGLVRVHLALDDLDAAREQVRAVEAVLAGDRLDVDDVSPWSRGLAWPEVEARGARPRLERAEGDLAAAIEGFETAREAAREAGDRQSRVEFGCELGATLRMDGDLERARRVLTEARDLAADADYRRLGRECERELERVGND